MALGFKTLVEEFVQFVEPTAYDLRSGAPSPADPQPMATAVLVPASSIGAQRRPEICSVLCAMAMAAMGRGQPKEADTETDRVDRDLRDDRDDLAHDLPGFARQLCRELQQKRPQ